MFKHLYTLCWNQKGANGWLWAEMLIVSLVLWFVVDIIYVNLHTYFLPMGHDIENVYRLYFSTKNSTESHDDAQTRDDWTTILNRISTYPGVEKVSCSLHAIPYTWSISTRSLETDTLHKSHGQYRRVSPEFFQVFRITGEGQNEASLASIFIDRRACILSTDIVKEIFESKSPIGEKISINKNDSTDYLEVKALMKYYRRADYQTQNRFFFAAYTSQQMLDGLKLTDIPMIEVCVRVSPDATDGFDKRFSKEMSRSLRVGNIYLMNTKSLNSLKRLFNRPETIGLQQTSAMTFFLLINLFLGIVGTFWIRTQFRKGEMGLRVAMGSTRRELISLLTGEGLVLFLFSFIPAVLIGLNIGLSELLNIELMPFTVGRFLITQTITFVLMTLMIAIGVWIPTYQYTKLQPAEALRYE